MLGATYKAGNWKELYTNSQGLMLELSSEEFGSWRERDPLGYVSLYMVRDGVGSKSEHTDTANGTWERGCQKKYH